jgi:hypothetical protein
MTSAVAKKVEASVPAVSTPQQLGINVQDLVIPRVLLMQNTSEYVGESKAKMGDLINSQTLEKIGGLDKPVGIVPLRFFKTIRVYDCSGKQPKFLRVEDWTAEGERLPWEGQDLNREGKKVPVRRYLTFNFYALLTEDLDRGEAFPIVISFRSTSLQAGKALATQIFKMSAMGRQPYTQSVKLGAAKKKADTNTWAVLEILSGKDHSQTLSEKQIAEARKWTDMISSMKVTVDEEQEETEVSSAPPAEPVVMKAPKGTPEENPY